MIISTPVNTCVCCGEIIPEGKHICYICEKKSETPNPKYTGKYAIRNKYTMAFLLKSMNKPRIFLSRTEAWEYMKANKLNPRCFEIEKIR
jgi:hypothetical protein